MVSHQSSAAHDTNRINRIDLPNIRLIGMFRRAMTRMPHVFLLAAHFLLAGLSGSLARSQAPVISIWQGDLQRVGHLGDAQKDFNIVGHIEPWEEVTKLNWRLNSGGAKAMTFRAFRRLVSNGDFNADIPISLMVAGTNQVKLTAQLRDGRKLERTVLVEKTKGSRPLPCHIRWRDLQNVQDAGQVVDGKWDIESGRLRTLQTGYDRLFLIGERTWRDYQVRSSFVINSVSRETTPLSGGNGVGFVFRFCGHVVGGPRQFPAAQPKWGYQPFGAIGWLRWDKGKPALPPVRQFYAGDSDRELAFGRFPVKLGRVYSVLLACETLPEDAQGRGVTRYSFKIWDAEQPEPADWDWQQVQASETALRFGGLALVAHHADVSFGDFTITEK